MLPRVTTAGASAVPGDPEACLRRYGLWGVSAGRASRGAARVARICPTRVRRRRLGDASVTVTGSRRRKSPPRYSPRRSRPRSRTRPGLSTSCPVAERRPRSCGTASTRTGRILFGRREGGVRFRDGRRRTSRGVRTVSGHFRRSRSPSTSPRTRRGTRGRARGFGARRRRRSRGWADSTRPGEKIDGVLAGDCLPSTATGPDGRVVQDDAGAVVTRREGGENAKRIATFDVSAGVGAEANKAAIERVAAGEMPTPSPSYTARKFARSSRSCARALAHRSRRRSRCGAGTTRTR